jgi:hypothetical protein
LNTKLILTFALTASAFKDQRYGLSDEIHAFSVFGFIVSATAQDMALATEQATAGRNEIS